MKIYRKGYFWFTAMIMVFALVMILGSFSYSAKARLVPLIVGSSALIMCTLLLLGEKYPWLVNWLDVSLTDFVSKDSEVASRFKTGGEDGGSISVKRVLASVGWMCGLFISIFLIGFFCFVII